MSEHLEPFIKVQEAIARGKEEGAAEAAKRLAELDKAMAGVVEVLVDLLIAKGVLSVNDLNQEVRRIMAERHSLRVLMKVK